MSNQIVRRTLSQQVAQARSQYRRWDNIAIDYAGRWHKACEQYPDNKSIQVYHQRNWAKAIKLANDWKAEVSRLEDLLAVRRGSFVFMK